MPADLSEGEWREVLDDLRAQVSALGFGDWDHHAGLAVEGLHPSEAAMTYLRSFIGKQRRATAAGLGRLRAGLLERLTGPEGERVITALVVDDRFEGAVEYDLFEQVAPTDDFVDELLGVLAFLESGDESELP
jgi:hypothetical protein